MSFVKGKKLHPKMWKEAAIYVGGSGKHHDWIIAANKLTLEDWLTLLDNPPKRALFEQCMFPSDEMRQEYLANIDKRSEGEVKNLLRHLLPETGTYQRDVEFLRYIIDSNEIGKLYEPKTEYFRRLLGAFGKRPVWEGLTWVLDLLPTHPQYSLDVIHAYFLAHIQHLTDSRAWGLEDAMAVVRAKFIHVNQPAPVLIDLNPTQFENLVDVLYSRMGYKTRLTPKARDWGVDIFAEKSKPGERELLIIQCKHQQRNVNLSIVQRTHGIVAHHKATKGVLVTSADFTGPAKKYVASNPQMELINRSVLTELLNSHLGANWTSRVDRLIAESVRRSMGKEISNRNHYVAIKALGE